MYEFIYLFVSDGCVENDDDAGDLRCVDGGGGGGGGGCGVNDDDGDDDRR